MAVLSHELRTPLHTVIAAADLMSADAGTLSVSQASYLRAITSAGHDLLALVEYLLEAAELILGSFTLELESVLVADVVARAVSRKAQKTEQCGVRVDVGHIPEVLLQADALRLVYAVEVLLDNALDVTPAGGRVALSVRIAGPWVRVALTDGGDGMTRAAHRGLFGPFRHASNVLTRHGGGVGVGLFLAHQVVSRHGGSIGVDTTAGRGSCFTLSLPLQGAV